MRKTGVWVLAGLMILLVQGIFSDVVILQTGERRLGLVMELKEDPDNVLFETNMGEMKIPRARIARIDKEAPDISYIHIAKGYFQSKDYSKAREYADKALKANPNNTDAAKLIEDIQKSIQDEAQRRLTEKEQQFARSLDEIKRLMAEDKPEEAQVLMDKLQRADLSDPQKEMVQSTLAQLYYQLGLRRLDQLNPRGAAEYFEQSLALNPDNEEVFNRLLTIWQQDPTMTARVIAIYEKRYAKKPGDLETARILASLYLRNNDREKALPYLIVVQEGTKGKDPVIQGQLKETLSFLHENAASNKQFGKAADYFKVLLEFFPNEDSTPLYFYQYSDKLKNLAPDDLEGRNQLGDFCKEHNLEEEGRGLYLYVLDRDPKNERALAGLNYYAQKDLAEAQDAFQKKDYDIAVYLVGQITNNYIKLPDVLTKAYEMKERAENEIRREAREKSARALALARKGDDYYATADQYINALKSTERRGDVRIVSDKEQAKLFLKRAIAAWESALKVDPSLAAPENEDLTTKLRDARAKLLNLTTVLPFPKTDIYKRKQ